MKISNGSPHPTIQQQAAERAASRKEAGSVKEKTPGKPAPKGDTVEFSASLDTELTARQAEQAKRVESIKAQLQSGAYQAASRDVAEKMLSRNTKS